MEPADILQAGDDARERGLHFICFNTHIGRQFEFIQHTWVNSPKFDGLYADDDPLVGDRGAAGKEPAGPSPSRRSLHASASAACRASCTSGAGPISSCPASARVRFLAALP